ncbi:hypothetical protein DFH29DRAFT_815521, partial [Suillus ampliporus]
AVLPKLRETFDFIVALKHASLDDPVSKLSDDAIERLCNPPRGPIDIDNPGTRQSIAMYLSLQLASQDA